MIRVQRTVCHVAYDEPASGVLNMAVDETRLAQAAATTGEVDTQSLWLRFYRWNEPTLSLGYFQRLADRADHPVSAGCPVVRRSSGGGAILHDRELTYSLVAPGGHPLARQPLAMYEAMHRSLIAALRAFRITAFLHDESPVEPFDPAASRTPFLCFRRRSGWDVLVDSPEIGSPPAKVCGSAQRRRRGAVLQHGSVLLARSGAAPELPGMAELAGIGIAPGELGCAWEKQLNLLYSWNLRLEDRSMSTAGPVLEAALTKYASAGFTARR